MDILSGDTDGGQAEPVTGVALFVRLALYGVMLSTAITGLLQAPRALRTRSEIPGTETDGLLLALLFLVVSCTFLLAALAGAIRVGVSRGLYGHTDSVDLLTGEEDLPPAFNWSVRFVSYGVLAGTGLLALAFGFFAFIDFGRLMEVAGEDLLIGFGVVLLGSTFLLVGVSGVIRWGIQQNTASQ